MNSSDRHDRWLEIEQELRQIADGKVDPDDPATREAELLVEQGYLEWEAGQDFTRQGVWCRAHGPSK
ncbi:MAG TPA: hypothetical protein VGX76_03510 [Pirellulales bacterium]|nr:hypothetical protein [Pirellulales bacterium]